MTKILAEKQWTRPELIHLGTIANVAGIVGISFQNNKHQRS